MPTDKLCKSIPRAVRKHATFVADTTSMDSSDIIGYEDFNGSWKEHTKPRRKYVIEVCDVTGSLLVEEYSVFIQYYFEGGIEVPVNLAKHGNAKKENS